MVKASLANSAMKAMLKLTECKLLFLIGFLINAALNHFISQKVISSDE
jgi:hypothetical protein